MVDRISLVLILKRSFAMSKTYGEWRDEIEQYLTTHKSFFQINQKMSNETVHKLETYFVEKGFLVEVRHCSQCSGWDILIQRNS